MGPKARQHGPNSKKYSNMTQKEIFEKLLIEHAFLVEHINQLHEITVNHPQQNLREFVAVLNKAANASAGAADCLNHLYYLEEQ